MNPAERIIVALDVPKLAAGLALADRLNGAVGCFKVGLELFAAGGPDAVRWVRARGKVFLDLKLHDIPETVGRATAVAAGLGVDLITVHSSGGRAMMARAAKEAHAGGARIIAVTALTSLDEHDLEEVRIQGPLVDLVIARARLAQEAGCDGVVASPHEAAAVRSACGPSFLIVTPGVRPAGAPVGDQTRVAPPRAAVQAGADYIVVGRPITGAPDVRSAAQAIADELAGG
ncbi:MAG: orotidine-5'-phosphate decarboxylase [Deltaproteobacteria bacterium]|nr:orotidine-5'-phosphate decarboxylase [Deltaproteobacteria bacterium]